MKPFPVRQFFEARRFTIPSYQRDFAWEDPQIDDLLSDVAEAAEHGARHFLGTFILHRKHADGEAYDVVDGQQRLATITMLACALRDAMAAGAASTWFMVGDGQPRLALSDENSGFFTDLLAGRAVTPTTPGQRRLRAANARIRRHISERVNEGVRGGWLRAVAALEVVEVGVTSEGDAIRMLQTLNNRGKPVSEMEKAKSLLVSHSNRFLDGALDAEVNRAFGEMFRAYEDADQKADGLVPLVNRWRTEDFVFWAHATTDPLADLPLEVMPGPQSYALRHLEGAMRKLRSDRTRLASFINSWVNDLHGFFAALARIVEKTMNNVAYRKLLCVLDVSHEMPALLVRLELRGLLDASVPNNPDKTFLDLVETTEMRVYNADSHPEIHALGVLALVAGGADPARISSELLCLATRWGHARKHFGPGSSARRVFVEYEGSLRGAPLTLDEVRRLHVRCDWILANETDFSDERGFQGENSPWWRRDSIGNLTVVEWEIADAATSLLPEQKGTDASLYRASKLHAVQALTKELAQIVRAGGLWSKGAIEARGTELAAFADSRWPLWRSPLMPHVDPRISGATSAHAATNATDPARRR
jgi:hypothetical protein